MNFDTACTLVLQHTVGSSAPNADCFLQRLRQGQPPIPGQVTSLLLALRVIHQGLHNEAVLDRTLVQAFLALSYESRQLFTAGLDAGVVWPPLLDQDLKRLAKAVQTIVADHP